MNFDAMPPATKALFVIGIGLPASVALGMQGAEWIGIGYSFGKLDLWSRGWSDFAPRPFSLIVQSVLGALALFVLTILGLGIGRALIAIGAVWLHQLHRHFDLMPRLIAIITIRTVMMAGALLMIPLHALGDRLGPALRRLITGLIARIEERSYLRRLYREKYAVQFKSFAAFKRVWNEAKRQEEQDRQREEAEPAAQADPYEAALDVLGLSEPFTKRELNERYRKLMKGVHPDVAGPNALAEQVNDARDIVMKRRGWT